MYFKYYHSQVFLKCILNTIGHVFVFLQRVSIACYGKRCTSYRKSVCLTVRLTVRLTVCHSRYHAKTTQARICLLYTSPSPRD